MAKVQFYVDSINLMTYDMYGGDKNTGHHSPLYENPDDPKHVSSNKSVHNYIRKLAGKAEQEDRPRRPPSMAKAGPTLPPPKTVSSRQAPSSHDLRLDYGSIESILLKPGSGYVRYWDYQLREAHLISLQRQAPKPG